MKQQETYKIWYDQELKKLQDNLTGKIKYDKFFIDRSIIKGKVCNKCNKFKEPKEFYLAKTKEGLPRLNSPCIECCKKYIKENREKTRERGIKKTYNITREDYNTLLKKQENKCSICKKDKKEFNKELAIDHNHKTGKVRGLLCSYCNTGLGLFKDNIELLKETIKYLENNTLDIK